MYCVCKAKHLVMKRNATGGFGWKRADAENNSHLTRTCSQHLRSKKLTNLRHSIKVHSNFMGTDDFMTKI